MNNEINPKYILIAIGSLLLSYLVYFHGFSGGFYFDDIANLANLSNFSSNKGIDSLINYIMSFEAGSLKRPISTLSFLIHDRNWPTSPYLFKLFNYFFHILNAFLLFFTIINILKLLKYDDKSIVYIAFLSALFWLVNPFFVSTVLYSVQRMAIMPVIFILLGFISYSYGRRIIEDSYKKGVVYLFLAVYGCTFFAAFSKENGVLLPMLLLLFEIIIVKSSHQKRLTKKLRFLLFYFPIFIIITGLTYKMPNFLNGYGIRDFTMGERLLTESRALIAYLAHLFIPSSFTEGIFTDAFVKSTSLFKPISTLFSVISIVFLISFSIIFRKRTPILSFAILFYFLANILESTIIPLELYFEHRAYLPSIFLFLPVSILIVKLVKKNIIFTSIPLLIVIVLCINTYQKTSIWGDSEKLYLTTTQKYPHSVRAFILYSDIFIEQKRLKKTIQVLEQGLKYNDSVDLMSNKLNLECFIPGAITNETILDFKQQLARVNFDLDALFPFQNFINTIALSECPAVSATEALNFISIIENKGIKFDLIDSFLYYNKAVLHINLGQYDLASNELITFIENDKSIVNKPKIVFKALKMLKTHKQYTYIMKVLNELEQFVNNIYKVDSHSYLEQINNYRKMIKNLQNN